MGAISSISSVLGIKSTSTPVTAAIGELDSVTGAEKNIQAFQYFPEQISDSKSPNYSKREVPGGSHPITTFLNGGERGISFSAVFTQDENPEKQGLLNQLLTGSLSLDLNPAQLFNKTPRKDTADIASAIGFLRSFTYPEYKNDVAIAPPLCVVYLPNSGIVGHPNIPDSITGVMTQCDVTYEAFHRNGAPRIAIVQLNFVEVVQVGPNWKFVGRESIPGMLAAMGHKPYTRATIGLRSSKKAGIFNGGILGGLGL